jgi:hypothetical protein
LNGSEPDESRSGYCNVRECPAAVAARKTFMRIV